MPSLVHFGVRAWSLGRAVRSNSCDRILMRTDRTPGKALAAAGFGSRDQRASTRILQTDEPCIVQMQRMLAGKPDVLSLAQGIVHWQPPKAALDAAASFVYDPRASRYCPDDGIPELREALAHKLAAENGLQDADVMVTAGANQGFMNIVLALLDAGSKAVLFAPYYFNHLMALQMTGAEIEIAECDARFVPDMDKLEAVLAKGDVTMVVLCNPCNPTGVVTPKATLERCAEMCKKAGAWLVLDNTYEHFTYDGAEHHCVQADHVINLFSFSKAFGMMGWRIGYVAIPAGGLRDELLKAQDTIPICPTVTSQIVALNALQSGGRAWVNEKIAGLAINREVVRAALKPLGDDAVIHSDGAIYMWMRLPEDCPDDKKVVEWLVNKHGVCVIPGSACGMPGYLRVAFSNNAEDACAAAAARLERGLHQLVTDRSM
mmetsp:Transcript_3047/g.5771  ORF Transcript_3047/g.5771 Transcript_3047/m.5771 type:complete len:432 (+) Transcript_3047:53-1348(+)|eukprot:CAMPEP_0114249700 /NCGR_PEP_ID=MMETSP0058-20121206/14294_1 /TAXON_ID=36894 /ORGANISM="Pyramimonas parkeae, CCMP726" /LENGTH=431 /DNA_ID=CAMNT_0001363287 /DNA_START=18 /DNA_END=1313 /DNA_ORIENTATION=+